jgi:hypothetical protein
LRLNLFPGGIGFAAGRITESAIRNTRMVVLSDLHGLWRRTLIAWPDDRFDIATEVYWLQGPRSFADLRIPPGAPKHGGGSCLRDLDWPMLRFMALQEGFIGHLEIAGGIAHWHRLFDFQPQDRLADKGRLEFQNEILVERGVERPYVEHWRREPTSDPEVVALWLSAGPAQRPIGCLIATAEAFIYARGRALPLPRGTTLSNLVDDALSLRAAQDLFDCEISFGRRGPQGWRIERSSLPFRAGQSLAPAIDGAGRSLAVGDLTAEGKAFRRAWRIAARESTAAAFPFDWFAFHPAGIATRSQELETPP